MSSQNKIINKKVVILGQEIAPGKHYELNLNVAKLHTSTPVQIPIYVDRAKIDGPTVVLMAGMHGDEINGIEIIRRIIRKKLNRPMKGTVICIPVFNIFGFLNLKRELPDGRDLNRSFPGTPNGSLASQFAFQFMKEIAPVADVIIDFHTGAAQRNNFPQIRCDFDDQESLELAKVFNSPIILDSGLIAKTIREVIQKLGKKYLIFEGGKANSIEEMVVDEGINGAKRILNHFGMRSFKIDISTGRDPIFLTESKWLRAPNSGLFLPQVQNGNRVNKGAVIGLIMDPFGKIERTVKAQRNAVVLCVNEAPTVYKGDAIFHLAIEVDV
ncbi:MAG: succinylglutamate desuccinylase/aspartoacylase family protein [Crocinitomicaceae bacterium]|nr:succinylglutamate desuccinylase/aspartoacylase family protein [Crocinitomicaceae bacterium]